MERQLKMGGGIMNLEPRQNYGLGDVVKKITGGVKSAAKSVASGIGNFIKSDAGKLALLAAGTYGLGGGSFFGRTLPTPFSSLPLQSSSSGLGGFSFGNIGTNIGRLTGLGAGGLELGTKLGLGKATEGAMGKFGTGALAGTVLGSVLAGGMGTDEEATVGGERNIGALRTRLTKAYRELRYPEEEIPALVEADLAEYTGGPSFAVGGRVGYGEGSDDYESKFMKLVGELMEAGFSQQQAIEEARERLSENKANGGRIGYAFGNNNPEQNAINAAGIMGLPLNQNPAGATELDMRDTGGFIPPVGVKEKEDDIPAMLSNNEFVFTADAVRGMGDGDVNVGAQRMYDMMKKLENGGRV
jgi:hypothetical protein